MTDWQDWVGRTQRSEDRLTPALLQRFRATIEGPQHEGTGPQGIHWVLCTPDAPMSQLGEDGHPLRNDRPDSFLPPIPLPRRMWASSSVEFLAPIPVDAEIARRSSVTSIREKSGSSGALAFVDVSHETSANGAIRVRETQTLVYREANSGPAAPRPPSVEVDPSGWDHHRRLVPDAPLLFRFSAITFNTHRIHYDVPYAMDAEGYRGLVVHGPLMATLLLRLAAEALGDQTLRTFSFRAMSPAFAGEPLHLALRRSGPEIEFAAIGDDGTTRLAASGTV